MVFRSHQTIRLVVSLLSLLVSSDIAHAAELDDVDGFLESRIGVRVQDDQHGKSMSLGELRLQVETEKELPKTTFTVVTDLIIDRVADKHAPDFQSGDGAIDLRQLNLLISPAQNVDLKLGRQILTWGTGDLIFINDSFAKDWESFLLGRDEEYLKAPTDAAKLSVYFSSLNADLVYVPRFSADRFVDGDRVSFFDRSLNDFRGDTNPLDVDRPDRWFRDDELSLRLYRNFASIEAALYYYSGFWKSPAGFDAQSGKPTFPELRVIGASVRSALAGGVANLELGHYMSNDNAQHDPLIRNSENRILLGFEKEIATELTAGGQYYLERKLNYRDYLDSLPSNAIKDDENRSVITLRLTKLLLQQNLRLSLFNFFSPSDDDGLLRINVSYKLSDEIKVEAGGNFFYGDESHTFYSQFQDNSNVYAAIRYGF